MARKFTSQAKVKCQYCNKAIEDKTYLVHMTLCKEKEKHIQKILNEIGEIPY